MTFEDRLRELEATGQARLAANETTAAAAQNEVRERWATILSATDQFALEVKLAANQRKINPRRLTHNASNGHLLGSYKVLGPRGWGNGHTGISDKGEFYSLWMRTRSGRSDYEWKPLRAADFWVAGEKDWKPTTPPQLSPDGRLYFTVRYTYDSPEQKYFLDEVFAKLIVDG